MPQPLSRVSPNARVDFSIEFLRAQPVLARIICSIISLSARVDFELNLLIVKMLGADARPAIAMFDALNADSTKRAALNAAAGAVLTDPQLEVFEAVIKTATSAQKPRHKIAHWIWGSCSELPTALLLANPAYLRRQDIERELVANMGPAEIQEWVEQRKTPDFDALYEPNKNEILVFDLAELAGVASSLVDAGLALFYFRYYLSPEKPNKMLQLSDPDPMWKHLETSEGALRQLESIRLFREFYRAAAEPSGSE